MNLQNGRVGDPAADPETSLSYAFLSQVVIVNVFCIREREKQESCFSNQNGEAKRERVARMRRARSMPKMDDQEVSSTFKWQLSTSEWSVA